MTSGNFARAAEAIEVAASALRARREALRAALVAGDTAEVVRCARRLIGMDGDEEASDRTDPGIGSRPVGP